MAKHVVTIRREGEKTAHGHIAADETKDRTFCGISVPTVVLEMWGDPRNPYQGKGLVTCDTCLAEFRLGRVMGSRGDSATPSDETDSEAV